MLFGWSKSRFIISWDERLCDTEAVSLISDENIYESSDSFSLCYPSDDIFSESLRGTKHMLFKQVPEQWYCLLTAAGLCQRTEMLKGKKPNTG